MTIRSISTATLLPLVSAVVVLLGLAPVQALSSTPSDWNDAAGSRAASADVLAAAEPLRLIVHSAASSPAGGFSVQQHAAIEVAAEAMGLQPQRDLPGIGAVTYQAGSARQLGEAAAVLRKQPGVAFVERDAAVMATAVTPDDNWWDSQWGPRRISSPSAWSVTTGSAEVTIAVLDTGVAAGHPDLVGNLDTASGANFTLEGASTDTADRNGHGTSSAGVAAAVSNNVEGIAGSCWTCEIMPVKVLDKDGMGSVSDLAAGMVHAVDAGADVLNLSMGTLSDLQLLRQAVDYAIAHDVAIVASAGNFGNSDGSTGQERVYPAAYPDVLGVAASDENDDRYAFSSFGDWVSVAAPGCNVATDLVTSDLPYRWFCGTSSSAPLVAGVVGLAISIEPGVSPARLSAVIAESSDPLGYVAAGRVDAAAALAALAGTEEPVPDDEPLPPPDGGGGEVESEPGLRLVRVAGANRYETAVRLSMQAYEPGVQRVFLTTGTAFADALAGGAVAGRDKAPVLLTRPTSLPDDTKAELERLAPDEIVVLGGPAAVSDEVKAAAGAASTAPTRRVAGTDRYDTASRLARQSFDAPAPVAYIATGVGFADALAGVPAAVAEGGPMLLTAPRSLPLATRFALEELQPERIVVLGGTSAISTDVITQLDAFTTGGVRRLAGANRYETAARVSSQIVAAGASEVYLATGLDFPDALAAGPLAGQSRGPVLLTTRDTVPSSTRDELRRIQPSMNVTLGGTAVISQEAEAVAGEASAAGSDTS